MIRSKIYLLSLAQVLNTKNNILQQSTTTNIFTLTFHISDNLNSLEIFFMFIDLE